MGDRIDACAFQESVRYQIDVLEWIDQTPVTSSPVGYALSQVHNGFLNLFEDAVALFS